MAAFLAIIYPAKFLNTIITENKELFISLGQPLRQIAEIMKQFPRDLLYIRQNQGGIRLPNGYHHNDTKAQTMYATTSI